MKQWSAATESIFFDCWALKLSSGFSPLDIYQPGSAVIAIFITTQNNYTKAKTRITNLETYYNRDRFKGYFLEENPINFKILKLLKIEKSVKTLLANETVSILLIIYSTSETTKFIFFVIVFHICTNYTKNTIKTQASKSFAIKSSIGDKTVSKKFLYTKEQENFYSSSVFIEEKLSFKRRILEHFAMPPPLMDPQQLQIAPAKRRRKREDPQSCTTPEVRKQYLLFFFSFFFS